MTGANQEGRYRMRTFSKLTGLSPTVLRAWERRYGLLEPLRPDGGHRLYTEDDLQVIRRVTQLLEEGRTIGEVAALGRTKLMSETEAAAPPPSVQPDAVAVLRSQIVDSARRLDSVYLSTALDRAFSLFSLDVVLTDIVQPAAYDIGDLWANGTISVAGEHMVSSALTGRFERLRNAMAKANRNAPVVVCACLPGEQHELGLLILSLRIANAGYRVSYLGRDLPLDELEKAAIRLRARAVCLSVKQLEVLKPCAQELVDLAQRWSGQVRVHLGGLDIPTHFTALRESEVRVWPRYIDSQTLFDELFEYS